MLLRLRWGTTARSTRPIAFLSFACAIASACPASAQEQTTTELPPVVVEGATLAAPPATPKQKPAPVSNTPGETDAAAQPTASQSGEASASSDVSGVPADQIGTAVTVITRKDSRTARSATRRMRCATCPASR